MRSFRQFFLESEEKHHDITFMRANPPHVGHQQVVQQVKNSALEHGGDHSIVLSRSQDAKKNPLSPEQKIGYARIAFPNTNVQLATQEAPTLLHQASNLHDKGVTHLHVHVGSDRVDSFKQLLNSYNGQQGRHGYYNFKQIHVHPVGGERDPDDDEGIAGASATAMRSAAETGNRTVFHKMAPTSMNPAEKDAMMRDVYNGMHPPKPNKAKI